MNKLAVDINSAFQSPFGSQGGKGIGDLVSTILNVSFSLAGVLILFFLVIAGFNIIKSAGSGDQQSAQKAKSAATSAAIGFVIIFAAYWIIRLIELLTGSNFITQPGI